MSVKSLMQRFDRSAITQLRQVASMLVIENDQLRSELARAYEDAEFWREQAMSMQEQLADELGGQPGIIQDGSLVIAARSINHAPRIH